MNFDDQADASRFEVRDQFGTINNISEVIFPVLKVIDEQHWRFIGTGFFIATNGLFVTAKHVLLDAVDSKANFMPIFQFHPDGTYLVRYIRGFVLHPSVDVGIGFFRPLTNTLTGEELINKKLLLTAEQPAQGETIFTHAYPKTMIRFDSVPHIFLYPGYYVGRLEEYYPNGRDRVLLPYPCYRTSITLHEGASGGPVFDSNGRVFGVNAKSFDGSPDISFVCPITDILSIILPGAQVGKSSPAPITILELARQGHLSFNPPLPL